MTTTIPANEGIGAIYIHVIGGIPDFLTRTGSFAVVEEIPERLYQKPVYVQWSDQFEPPREARPAEYRLRINKSDLKKTTAHFESDQPPTLFITRIEQYERISDVVLN